MGGAEQSRAIFLFLSYFPPLHALEHGAHSRKNLLRCASSARHLVTAEGHSLFFSPCHHQGKEAAAAAKHAAANDRSIGSVSSLTFSLQLLNELGLCFYTNTLPLQSIIYVQYIILDRKENVASGVTKADGRYAKTQWECVTKGKHHSASTLFPHEMLQPSFLSPDAYIYDNVDQVEAMCSSVAIKWLVRSPPQTPPKALGVLSSSPARVGT